MRYSVDSSICQYLLTSILVFNLKVGSLTSIFRTMVSSLKTSKLIAIKKDNATKFINCNGNNKVCIFDEVNIRSF